MDSLTFKELVAAARQLPPSQKAALIQTLQSPGPELSGSPTREELVAELEALRAAGAFDHVESLYGRYADMGVDVSDEELRATIHKAATEWESELDEFFDDED